MTQIYDKLLLVVALVALLGSAVFLVMLISKNRDELQRGTFEQDPPGKKTAAAIDDAQYQKALAGVSKPYQVDGQSRVLTSKQRVSCVACSKPIPFNAVVCPFCKADQPAIPSDKDDTDLDGIPDAFETKFGLNAEDPTDAQMDMDHDLFSNVEEFRSGTDLNSATNFPSPISKLRLVKSVKVPFKLRFVGISEVAEGDVRYQLNLRTLDRTYFAKMGEEVEGYKVASYEPAAEKGQTLLLTLAEEKISLVKGEVVIREGARSAMLISLLDGKTFKVQVGDVIQVKEQNYKVVDIGDAHVLLRDEQTGRETTIGQLTEDEKARLQGGMGGAGQPIPSGSSTPGRVR
jgi:hypothetical protein